MLKFIPLKEADRNHPVPPAPQVAAWSASLHMKAPFQESQLHLWVSFNKQITAAESNVVFYQSNPNFFCSMQKVPRTHRTEKTPQCLEVSGL